MLLHQSWTTANELSEKFGVSTRCIREDIQSIRNELGETHILSNNNKGYKAISYDAVASHEDNVGNHGRYLDLLVALITCEEVDLYEIEITYYSSASTTLRDLKKFENYISLIGLQLSIIKKGKNISLEGRYIEKIALLSYLCFNEMHIGIESVLSKIDLPPEKISMLCSKFSDISQLITSDDLALGIALIYKTEKSTNNNYTNLENIFNSNLQNRVAVKYQNELKEYIEKCRIFIEFQYSDFERNYMMSITNNGIHYINEKYDVNFNDTNFISALNEHLLSLYLRSKFNILVNNPIINLIRNKYMIIFDMAADFSVYVGTYMDIEITPFEVAYIATYFGGELKRIETNEKNTADIALIYHTHFLLANRIKKQMQDLLLDQRCNINLYEKEINATEEIRLFLEDSAKINDESKISYSFDEVDRSKVLKKVEKYQFEKKEYQIEKILDYFIHPDCFRILRKTLTKTELIQSICANLETKKIVDQKYYNSVIFREELFSTELSSGIAIPHSEEEMAFSSRIYIVLLKKSIEWDKNKIHSVFMFAIAKKDRLEFRKFYELFSVVLENEEFANKLKTIESFSEFKGLLISYMSSNLLKK